MKNAQQPKPAASSWMWPRTEKHLALVRVPSPRVKRVEIRAARGLETDTADACGVVVLCANCVSCVS